MCSVSVISDQFRNNLPQQYPGINLWTTGTGPMPSREEFERLKAEVLELRELLKAAKRYDEVTGQKDCEMGDKVALLRKIAELVGVDLSEVFPSG